MDDDDGDAGQVRESVGEGVVGAELELDGLDGLGPVAGSDDDDVVELLDGLGILATYRVTVDPCSTEDAPGLWSKTVPGVASLAWLTTAVLRPWSCSQARASARV